VAARRREEGGISQTRLGQLSLGKENGRPKSVWCGKRHWRESRKKEKMKKGGSRRDALDRDSELFGDQTIEKGRKERVKLRLPKIQDLQSNLNQRNYSRGEMSLSRLYASRNQQTGKEKRHAECPFERQSRLLSKKRCACTRAEKVVKHMYQLREKKPSERESIRRARGAWQGTHGKQEGKNGSLLSDKNFRLGGRDKFD